MSAHTRMDRAKYIYVDGCKHPHEMKKCPTCGETKLIQKRRTFCSYRCSKWEELNPMWKGDDAKKASARLRAHKRFTPDKCNKCGTTEKLHRHHIDEDTYNNDPSNIEFLCASCHLSHHAIARGLGKAS